MRSYDVLWFNDIYILDVRLNGVEVRLRGNFVSYNSEALLIYMNEIGHNF